MIEELKGAVYKVRCPICGTFYNYKLRDLQFDEANPLGYTVCPACMQKVQHTLATIEEQPNEIVEEEQNK